MKVAWLPEKLDGNFSFENFKKASEMVGAENVSESFLYSNPKDVDFLILNFYEDIKKKFGFYIIAYIGRIIRLHYFRLKGIKIVWIINNKLAQHDSNNKYALKMMKYLIRFSDKIIILCHESVNVIRSFEKKEKYWDNKIVYLPHPNYIDSYPPSTKQFSDDEKFNLLFLGAVRPYKNIEVLIKAFKKIQKADMMLTIAGKPKNEEYKKQLESLISETDAIRLDLHFVPDEDISVYFARNSILVFPYSNESVLNSGSIILACSAGKTFISPKIGTVKDFPDDSLFYGYEYNDEQEHIEKLTEMMTRAYNDFCNDKNHFLEKGKKLKEYMKENNSLEVLAKIFKEELFTESN